MSESYAAWKARRDAIVALIAAESEAVRNGVIDRIENAIYDAKRDEARYLNDAGLQAQVEYLMDDPENGDVEEWVREMIEYAKKEEVKG